MRKEIIKRWEGLIRVTHIESRETERSIPDLQIRSFTADWWVELKRSNLLISEGVGFKIPWRSGQLAWLRNHERRNGNVALVYTIGNTWYVIQNISCMLQEYTNLRQLRNLSNYFGTIHDLPNDTWEIREQGI